MTKRNSRPKTSALEQKREALLQEALARPGIREVMEVYRLWQDQDEELNSYRTATRPSFKITYTNHTNVRADDL